MARRRRAERRCGVRAQRTNIVLDWARVYSTANATKPGSQTAKALCLMLFTYSALISLGYFWMWPQYQHMAKWNDLSPARSGWEYSRQFESRVLLVVTVHQRSRRSSQQWLEVLLLCFRLSLFILSYVMRWHLLWLGLVISWLFSLFEGSLCKVCRLKGSCSLTSTMIFFFQWIEPKWFEGQFIQATRKQYLELPSLSVICCLEIICHWTHKRKSAVNWI